MLNLIPHFINDKLAEGTTSGELEAATMSVDIVGFTTLTEALMGRGKQGAEILSDLINKIYTPLINIINDNNGFVSNFAGDAINAVFPKGNADSALTVALAIRDNFVRRRNYYAKQSGGYEINARIGLSAGNVSWAIFGEEKKAYCFFGNPTLECVEVASEIDAGGIAISETAIPRLSGDNGGIGIKPTATKRKRLSRIKPNIVKQFAPESVLAAGYGGEFRNVVPVFIAFEWSDEIGKIKGLVDDILSKADDYGGYFNGMFYDDKGPHILVVFGAPVSYENNAERAVDIAYGLRTEYGERIKAGITSGTVFAGAVGNKRRCTYTVLGDAVNLAARIMQSAEWGRIRVSADVASDITSQYDIEDKGDIKVKGKTDSVTVFEVETVTDLRGGIFVEGEMVGREKELSQLQVFCEPIFAGKFAGATYVSGEAGIGKSRLIHEYVNTIGRNVTVFTMQTDSVLRKSLNPFASLLKTYFRQSDENSAEDNIKVFDNDFGCLIDEIRESPNAVKRLDEVNDIIDELRRTKSLIGGILGLRWESSLYEELDPRGR
ncbi:MAG: adenylate/guanylate cyclase domain-containing protein, partial [bacterium]|nr:adenylate/guanylate cyclase domain-containing protein [bacterium]